MKIEFILGNEKKFSDFIGNLNEKDRIAVLAHNDGDGIISAVIASKILGKIDYLKFLSIKPDMFKSLIGDLKKEKITKIVIVDVTPENEPESLKEIEGFAEVLIIDHHKVIADLNSDRTIMIKVDSHFPASYACYYLFSKIQSIDDRLAALGVLSDTTPWKYNKDNAEQVFDDFKLKDKTNLFDETISLGCALVYFRDNEKKIYDILINSGLNGLSELKKYSAPIEKEVDFYVNDFEKNKEEHKDLIYYYFVPKYAITSMLNNVLSVKIRDKTFIIVTKAKQSLKISARRQDGKVDCSRLLREATKDIPNSNAGGHHNASGANIPVNDLAKFKKSLFKVYDEMSKNE